MKLLLGTTNPAKISDYKNFLIHSNLKLETLEEIGFVDEPLEIGKTFEENDVQKARFYAERTEYPTLADDGGFEIDFLDGRPGVESNRWLGPTATDEDKINKILELLRGVAPEQRTARLRFVTVVFFPGENETLKVEGRIEGVVPETPSPNRRIGFPYRPILFLPQFGKYFIDINEDEFQKINYRQKACKELLLKLEPYLNQ